MADNQEVTQNIAKKTAPEPKVQADSLRIEKVNREFQEKSARDYAKKYGLHYIDLSRIPLNPDYLKFISHQDSEKASAVSFFKNGNTLRIACSDPNKNEFQALKQLLEKDYELEVFFASEASIQQALSTYGQSNNFQKPEIVEEVDEKNIKNYSAEISDLSQLPERLEPLTSQEALNTINVAVMRTKASDLHFEPELKSVIMRLRIDGVLHKICEISHSLYASIVNQLKFEAKMKLNINNIPQDGRFAFTLNEEEVNVRVSALPTNLGESIVCRYLPSQKEKMSIEELGFQNYSLKKILSALKVHTGMILVTGPTGSGKTSTLYAILHALNNNENKIITLEDPVEYQLPGITQSQINEKRNYDFSEGIRAILRQDPDIVMVGEIRDQITAETALQAALTGHVVLSTLHTNSAIGAIPRLINMGVANYMVAPGLETIIAQRLVRTVCKDCVKMRDLSEAEKEDFTTSFKRLENLFPDLKVPEKIPEAMGCKKCSDTGYLGRMVISEVISVNNEIRELILNKASSIKIIEAARRSDTITMREDGMIKAAMGLTTLSEVYRTTNVVSH
jgi:type IV pilus assembly protein PilB